jgi:DNA polymerase III subunit gamma/tau
MSYLALYREWRPRTFDEVVEQKHAVFALRQAVISRQIGHAYLFSGTRGTGKTTLAKIFSRAINCLDPQDGNPCNKCEICRGVLDGSLLDVVEMDAASNNSVDNVRRITDEVNFMPSKAKYKVYIIDEVHMLTPGAFNALLKTLEEPPAHAVFILATTEPHRIPATILSRCQRYDFRRIPVESITARLAEIAKADGITIDASGLETIAAFADGALRDAISLLDQAKMSCAGTISRDDILALAGLAKDDALLELAHALILRDASPVLDLVDQLVMAGRDLARLIPDLAMLFRNLLICQVSNRPEKLVQATAEGLSMMRQLATQATQHQLLAWIRGLSSLLTDLRWAADTRTVLEVGLLRLMTEGQTEFASPVATSAATSTVLPARSAVNTAPVVAKPAPAQPVPAVVPVEPPIPDEPPFPDEPPAFEEPAMPDDQPLPDEPSYPNEPLPIEEPYFPGQAPVPSLSTDHSAPSAVSPFTAPPFDDPFSAKVQPATPAASANYDGTALWQKVLHHLSDAGQMTLFLFGRTARAEQTSDHVLDLSFAKNEKVHYDELRSNTSQKILRESLQAITGQVFELHFQIEGAPGSSGSGGSGGTSGSDKASRSTASPGQGQNQGNADNAGLASDGPRQPDWITKLQTTADTFGIPITMED